MKLHIKEFAELTGVSVLTLHYYDEIGLLKLCFADEQNGYRIYDERSLERMQEILFYRELDFSLKSIAKILSLPNYDKQKALAEQKKLLLLKKERLERLILALEQAEKGEITMNAFDKGEYEIARQQYEDEAKRRWGDTDAYKESTARTAEYSKEKWNAVSEEMDNIFSAFSGCMNSARVPTVKQHRNWSKSCKIISRQTFITAPKTFLQDSARCMFAMNGSRKALTTMLKAQRISFQKSFKIYCNK